MKLMADKNMNSVKFLDSVIDFLDHTALSLDAFLCSYGSAKILAKNLNMNNKQFYSTFSSLKKHGYIEKINEDQFLITPKALAKVRIAKIMKEDWSQKNWDGYWKMVVFDIPETKRKQRDTLRSLLKRKKFIGIQGSVFISPFADFEELAFLRRELGIEKYVSFFSAKAAETDEDKKLKERFNLN